MLSMKEQKPIDKKPYEPPAIRRVELHPEESLAAGCKTVSTGGSLPGSCTLPSDCFVSGS
jgi:hypothetical protein